MDPDLADIEDIEELMRLGYERLNAGNLSSALKAFSRVVALEPSFRPATNAIYARTQISAAMYLEAAA